MRKEEPPERSGGFLVLPGSCESNGRVAAGQNVAHTASVWETDRLDVPARVAGDRLRSPLSLPLSTIAGRPMITIPIASLWATCLGPATRAYGAYTEFNGLSVGNPNCITVNAPFELLRMYQCPFEGR